MSDAIGIRLARDDDLPALTELYNYYVTESHATFDDIPFDVDTRRREWFSKFAETGPHRLYVADDGGRAVGYASSLPFRPKPGYRTTVETTVYIDPDYLGKGLGGRLYTALFDMLAEQPLRRALGGVALPNDASIALHERFGFTHIGTYTEVGIKFDRYWDVAWYEKALTGV